MSLGGYQLPRLPTMNGRMVTWGKRWSRDWRRGSYLSSLACAASSKAVGDPSKGQLTSTMMAYESSGAMTVRSGLLLPDVPGRGCSLYLAPRESGTALMILSRIALCLSRIRPMLGWQWFSTCARVSWNLPHTRHSVDGIAFLQRACTVRTGRRSSLALCTKRYCGNVRKAPVYVKNVESGCMEREWNALPWSGCPVIADSLLTAIPSLRSCGTRCLFCQPSSLLEVTRVAKLAERAMVAAEIFRLERTALQMLCRSPALPSPCFGGLFRKETRSAWIVALSSGARLRTVAANPSCST